MTDTQRKRDPRYTRTVGEKPNQGKRYVENGKVKIEWTEDDKRRSKTIGDNSAETRREADEELERLLGLTDDDRTEEAAEDEVDQECEDEAEEVEDVYVLDVSWLVGEARKHADTLLDFADELAETFERGMVDILNACRGGGEPEDGDESSCDEDVEDAEVVEEIDDDGDVSEEDE